MPSLEHACESGGGKLSAPRLRSDTPERAGLDAEELRQLVQQVRDLTEGERPWAAGAVVVAGRGPVIAVEEAAGWAVRYASYDPGSDLGVELPPDARVPMTVDTPFDLASLTKLFTSVAAVQQIERGTLGIDARVGAYLPDFRAAAEHGITVRELLTHTSGLRPELPLYDRADDAERLAMLRAEPPIGVPGTYTYSDLNLLLLQHVLERITGRTLDVLVHDGITRPLGMTATCFGPCPGAAATEYQKRPWAKADRGMLRGVVHDENAWALGGVALPRRPVLHRPGPRGLLPRAAGGRRVRPRPHPRPRLRRAAHDPTGPGLRPRPAVVHGGTRGARSGRPHRLHGHLAGPGPGDGHVPGPVGEHGAPPKTRTGQQTAGGGGDAGGEGGAGDVTGERGPGAEPPAGPAPTPSTRRIAG